MERKIFRVILAFSWLPSDTSLPKKLRKHITGSIDHGHCHSRKCQVQQVVKMKDSQMITDHGIDAARVRAGHLFLINRKERENVKAIKSKKHSYVSCEKFGIQSPHYVQFLIVTFSR